MKTTSFKRIVIVIVFCVLICMGIIVCSRFANRKLDFVKQMSNGMNLGNALDSTNLRDYDPDASELDYETFWKNPKITREQLTAIHDAGFKTVRIPVTFEDHLDENFIISDIWMDRVEEVIKMALEEDLYVIMDLHGDTWLDLQVTQKEEIKKQFAIVWTQIATRFCEYDDHLLFEGMNEPRLRDSEYQWTEGTKELRDFVDELNQLFVDTVRSTGGNNLERYLLICPYCNGPWPDTVNELEIPKGNIIVAVHMYRPYNFCQNEEGTAEWDRESLDDTKEAKESFELMNKACIQHGIPVIFTEYGCIDKNNEEERIEWAKYYMELSKKYQIPCIWWDNGSTYQMLDRNEITWKYPDIVKVIVGNN